MTVFISGRTVLTTMMISEIMCFLCLLINGQGCKCYITSMVNNPFISKQTM